MRILISAGGTGGGVYPAFAVAETLQAAEGGLPPVDLGFVGGAGSLEPELLARSGIAWKLVTFIQGGPVHGVNPLRLIRSLAGLAVGLVQALRLVGRQRPDSVFLTGGWACLPVALAAWLRRVPVYAFVPDIEPGLTLKLVSRFARRVAVTTEESAPYFRPGQIAVTGYPLRGSLLGATRAAGIAHFGLDPARRTLLVVGGSSGARTINRVLLAILPDLLADESLQILHVAGQRNWDEVRAAQEGLAPKMAARYHAYAYLHDDMGLALAAADLAISRAGASSLGELPLFGLPAILVPYPFAWRYQKVNADYLVERGAAVRLDDELMGEELYPTVRRLLDDPGTLHEMAERARILARPDGALNVARLITGQEAV
jgi:undecaprenyldiphospho-muramoylpentapeptide beta-N-acetylglucosaminyltransferase